MTEQQNPLIGHVVAAVFLASDSGAIKFELVGREPVVANADGDCCSRTWIEAVQGVEQLIGATVVSVEDVGGVSDEVDDDGDVVKFYGCKITTDRGYCLIDYRNSSNGYYGGDLSWPGDGYFYGGVYGQNISNEDWRPIAEAGVGEKEPTDA